MWNEKVRGRRRRCVCANERESRVSSHIHSLSPSGEPPFSPHPPLVACETTPKVVPRWTERVQVQLQNLSLFSNCRLCACLCVFVCACVCVCHIALWHYWTRNRKSNANLLLKTEQMELWEHEDVKKQISKVSRKVSTTSKLLTLELEKGLSLLFRTI